MTAKPLYRIETEGIRAEPGAYTLRAVMRYMNRNKRLLRDKRVIDCRKSPPTIT
jgi:hypothetical protein